MSKSTQNTPDPDPSPNDDGSLAPAQTPHAKPTEEVRRIWVVTRMGVLGLYRSQLPRMAAALAFRTIFSIIPVMAIGLLIFGSVVSDEQVESGVRRVLTFAGISQISAVETQKDLDMFGPNMQNDSFSITEPTTPDTPALQTNPDAPIDPFSGADLEQLITDLITRVNASISNLPTGWIALTSGLVLLYAAMSMLIEIEKSFNQLCAAPSGRGWLRRLMLYWTILTAGSLLLAATFLAGDALTRWIVSFTGQDSIIGAMMAGYGASVLISTLLLLGAYTTIPNTRIHFRTALAGAFFAAVLWELGKLGFTAYLRYSTGYAKFYGSIAILPLFMLWVYLTWLIVLFGMQASYTLQNFSDLVESRLKKARGQSQREPSFIDPLMMIAIAREIQSGFQSGTALDAHALATRIKLDSSIATKLLDALTDAGITHRVYKGESFVGWAPTRPADQIELDDVLTAAYQIDSFRSSGVSSQIPTQIRDATLGACSGKTLADLLSNPGKNKGNLSAD